MVELLERAPSRGSLISPFLTWPPPIALLAGALYLVHTDGDVNDDVQQVSQGQAGYQNIRAISHALVLVNDSQQCGVSDDAQHEY